MGDVVPIRIKPWEKQSRKEIELLIRNRAETEENIIILGHPQKRMKERKVTRAELMYVLRDGHIFGDVALNIKGDWEASMVRRQGSTRQIEVVTIAVREDEKIIVKTVKV
ncbi:MAG: hypothetical protein ACPGOV_05200 [Magnetovibrionaceae bacterium]